MPAKPRLLTILDGLAILLLVVASLMIFLFAPMERTMGMVQKVFYFHVSTAWIGMVSFIVAAVAGAIYLIRKDMKWDRVSVSSVEIGLVFMLIAIVSGSIWARPAWNTWWDWRDVRLNTVTIMELLYAAYLMLRSGIDEPEKRARYGAVYVIFAFLSVPITFFAIRLLNSLHPVVIGNDSPTAQGDSSLTPTMVQTMLFSVFTFTVVYASLLWHRIRLGQVADKVEQLKLKIAQ